jgi:hypothetical protein
MRVIKFVLGLLLLMAPLGMAQDMQWQSMDGPCYVYDVTGISTGWDGTQMRAYMVASDLDAKYIYWYNGSSPINGWVKSQTPTPGVKHVNASRQNGWMAYATVPEGEGDQPGVHYTRDGGLTWSYNVNAQPGDKSFTCIETHPTNPNICFTGAELIGGDVASVWRTTTGGDSWSEIRPQGIDARNTVRAIHIDPNSGNDINNTTMYVCYNDEGTWRTTNGGGDWARIEFPDYAIGVNIVAKESDAQDLYALTRSSNYDPIYKLWHSTNGGGEWESFYNGDDGFGPDPVFKVLVGEYHDADFLWVISPSTIYTYIGWDPQMGPYWDWASGEYQCMDNDIGGIVPAGEIYAGLKMAVRKISYNTGGGDNGYSAVDVSKGSNIADIVSLASFVGWQLDALADKGGFVFRNFKIVRDFPIISEWATIDYLKRFQINPDDGEVMGDRLAEYPLGRITFAAFGHDNNRFYISDAGLEVDLDVGGSMPQLRAIAGPLSNPGWFERPYVGGVLNGENAVFAITDQERLSTSVNFGQNPPLVNDIICEEAYYEEFYYVCGARDNDNQNAVIYIRLHEGYNEVVDLNDGLDGVLSANSIIKSPEIYLSGYENYPMLYLGTEMGVYKSYYLDGEQWSHWRRMSDGINQGVEIIDLANYAQGVEYPALYKPDSLVEYALGKDAADLRYIYITADSGHSWIECGNYLREHALTANAITTISDIRNENPDPYYLAVGTDRGIYKFPYNVKSGVISGNEVWGALVIVNGDVVVPRGVTLTIAAGTTVKFTYDFDRTGSSNPYNSELTVYGTLAIDGTPTEPVYLTSSNPQPEVADWAGIMVYDGATLTMENCYLEYAQYGIISADQSNITITKSHISNCKEAGIFQKGPSDESPNVSGTVFENCGVYGALVVGGTPVFDSDTIRGNVLYGIVFNGAGRISITNSEITTTNSQSYWGISITPFNQDDQNSLFLANDYVRGFHQGGIYVENSNKESQIVDKVWAYRNGTYGLYLFRTSPEVSGSGSDLYNSFCENAIGIYCGKECNSIFRWNNLKENDKHGAYIEESANPDFGTERDPGNNSFRPADNNSHSCEMTSLNRDPIYAVYNFWTAFRFYGEIVWDPYLEEDPIPFFPKKAPDVPEVTSLSSSNHPNPFNSNTEIKFNLPTAGEATVQIYNITGARVKMLTSGPIDAGEHSVTWNGINEMGEKVASGIYFYTVSSGGAHVTKKMVYLK